MARAYDAIASDYEAKVAGDEWMRRALREHYITLFSTGQRVLDVGCGSGTDAVFLAEQGIRVAAIDVAPAMIARLRARVAAAAVGHLVESHVLDFAALDAWVGDPRVGTFDGIVAAFASLNTVPDLAPFAASAAHLLRPGGHLVVHSLNRWSLWEWLGLLRRGEWRRARALGRRCARPFVIGGRPLRHYPLAPFEAYREFFAPRFDLARVYGLGILRPPHTVRRVPPAVVTALGGLESRVRGWSALAGRGRFFVLDLVRRGDVGA